MVVILAPRTIPSNLLYARKRNNKCLREKWKVNHLVK